MERPLLFGVILIDLLLTIWAGLVSVQIHQTILWVVLAFLVIQEFFDWLPKPTGGSGGNGAQKR